MKIISAFMVLISVIYLWIGLKEKHAGIIIGGALWLVGAALVSWFHVWWIIFIVFVITLLLNKNPVHTEKNKN